MSRILNWDSIFLGIFEENWWSHLDNSHEIRLYISFSEKFWMRIEENFFFDSPEFVYLTFEMTANLSWAAMFCKCQYNDYTNKLVTIISLCSVENDYDILSILHKSILFRLFTRNQYWSTSTRCWCGKKITTNDEKNVDFFFRLGININRDVPLNVGNTLKWKYLNKN